MLQNKNIPSLASLVASILLTLTAIAANAQSIPAAPNRTCANCGAETATNNGWTSAVLSNGSLVVYGNNDIGSQVNNGEFAYYEAPPVPSTGQTQGYLNMNTYVGNGNDFNWYNSVTGITAGTEYQISILAIGTRIVNGQQGSCLSGVRLAIYADANADGQPDDPTTALESTQSSIVCTSTNPSEWTQVDLTFTATDSQAIVVIGPLATGGTTITDGTVVFGSNAISSTGGGGGSSSACDTSTDADCDGVLNTAEAAGEANNPCLPATSAYAIANCANLAVSKAYVGENTSNCASGTEWSIAVSNATGPGSASDVVVTDTLSSGAVTSMAVTASSTGTASCSVTGTGTGTATCTLNEDLVVAGSVTITVCS